MINRIQRLLLPSASDIKEESTPCHGWGQMIMVWIFSSQIALVLSSLTFAPFCVRLVSMCHQSLFCLPIKQLVVTSNCVPATKLQNVFVFTDILAGICLVTKLYFMYMKSCFSFSQWKTWNLYQSLVTKQQRSGATTVHPMWVKTSNLDEYFMSARLQPI